MKKNKIALLLAMALTLTQSVEMAVPVAASELEAETSQEVVQEEADAEEDVSESEKTEDVAAVESILDENTSVKNAEESNTEESSQDDVKEEAVEDVPAGSTEEEANKIELLDAEDEAEENEYLLVTQELKDAAGNPLNPFVGETVDIADLEVQLGKYSDGKIDLINDIDGHPVKIVVAQWKDEESGESGCDCDLNAWKPEMDQNQDITKLTRISEEATYISLTAMCQVDGEEWEQIACKTYEIAQADLGDEEKNPYDLNLDYVDTIGESAMLPEHEMTIKTNLVEKKDWSPIESYKLKVLFAPSDVTVTVKDDKDLLVKAGDKTGSFTCYVSVLLPDEKGEYKEAFKNRVIIEVSEYLLMPQELKDQAGKPINPAVGESINLADLGVKLGKYSDGKIDLINDIDGHPVKIVVASWVDEETGKTEYDCDLDAWELKNVEGQDLPILTRKQGYFTRIGLTALRQDADSKWHQIARKEYDIAEAEEAHSHEWVFSKIVKEPTCTEEGSKLEKCTSCEEERTVSIPAKGHTEVKDAAVAATCTTAGKTEGTHCSVCGKVLKAQETIPAKGHTEVKDAAVASTALVEGKTEGSHCSVCGTVLKKQNTIAKLTPIITLTAPDLKMRTGQSTTAFRAKQFAAGDYVTAVTSSNPGVVKVTEVKKNGTFRLTAGKKKGNATVTVTLASGKKATFKVTVQKGAVKTTKITTSAKSLTLTKGDTYKKLASSISVTPVTSKEKITYTSSNKKVATVSKNGVIRAKKAGTAKITVKSGKKKVSVTVKVKAVKTTNISGVPATKRITKGKTFKIKAVATPKNTDEKITFKSSNKKVATVTSKGVVKGKKKGTATITVQSGSKKVTCKVTVK